MAFLLRTIGCVASLARGCSFVNVGSAGAAFGLQTRFCKRASVDTPTQACHATGVVAPAGILTPELTSLVERQCWPPVGSPEAPPSVGGKSQWWPPVACPVGPCKIQNGPSLPPCSLQLHCREMLVPKSVLPRSPSHASLAGQTDSVPFQRLALVWHSSWGGLSHTPSFACRVSDRGPSRTSPSPFNGLPASHWLCCLAGSGLLAEGHAG